MTRNYPKATRQGRMRGYSLQMKGGCIPVIIGQSSSEEHEVVDKFRTCCPKEKLKERSGQNTRPFKGGEKLENSETRSNRKKETPCHVKDGSLLRSDALDRLKLEKKTYLLEDGFPDCDVVQWGDTLDKSRKSGDGGGRAREGWARELDLVK